MTRDPLLVNKIFGAVLAGAWALVIAGGVGMIFYEPEMTIEEESYPIAVEESTPAADTEQAAEAPAEPEPVADIATRFASADAAEGKNVARKCAACHTFDEGGANRVGPNLWDVVNRNVGGHDGYSYSSAMGNLDGEWSYETLDAFLADPKGYMSGTKMSFAGVKDPQDRADLIAYLRSLSNDPAPMP